MDPTSSERWVAEARMLSLCELPRSTFHSWERAGLLVRDPGGAYDERAVVEIALLASLREHFSLEDLVNAWGAHRQAGAVDSFIRRAFELQPGGQYDLVVEPQYAGITVAAEEAELVAAVRHPGAPRAVLVTP